MQKFRRAQHGRARMLFEASKRLSVNGGHFEASKRLRVDGGHELDPEELMAQLKRDRAANARVHTVIEYHARLVAAEQLAVQVGVLDRGALRAAELA